jgi:hypothetical protein
LRIYNVISATPNPFFVSNKEIFGLRLLQYY